MMTLTALRARTRYALRNGGDTTAVPPEELDIGIQDALADLVFDTKLTRTTNAGTALTADDPAGTLSITGFEPYRLFSVWLQGAEDTYEPLSVIPHGELVAKRAAGDSSGEPRYLAFLTDTTFEVYPTPDDADTYTPKFDWYAPAASFTAGTGSPDGVTFNVKDDVLQMVARWGAPSFIYGNQPEFAYAQKAAAEWAKFKQSITGRAGSKGAKSLQRGCR